jgi:hypothetical protein
MSYDVSLLGGDRALGRGELEQHLASLGLVANGSNHFVFMDAGKIYADADLAWSEGGDYTEPGERVNCIQVHIPAGFYESHSAAVLQTCEKLASHLEWRLFDEQEDKYLR